MFLRELELTNFRAIRHATVPLGPATTLIGENGCGMGSVLAALHLALGDRTPAISVSDFHHATGSGAPAGDATIRLLFEERGEGEWNAEWHRPLGPGLRGQAGKRQVTLELTASPPRDGRSNGWQTRVGGLRDEASTAAVVQHLRRMNPLLRLKGVTAAGPDAATTAERMAGAGTPQAVADLVERILEAADSLSAGTAIRPEQSIEAGAAAARALLAMSPRHFDPTASGLAQPVLEILGVDAVPSSGGTGASGRSVLTDLLGTLLLLSAILRHLPAGIGPGVEPLWIVEEPETNLHPMTLAATYRLLERIRWQKILTTHSGELLSRVPLARVRRLIRHDGVVRITGVGPRTLSREHLRRIGYHLRVHRGVAMFARVWLLVEGESEFWILPQVAQVLGYDLALEGICCVGFAQCGVDPLIRVARAFGIEWHLLADGDEAGRHYVEQAQSFARREELPLRISKLTERDIEHCFWQHGHAATIAEVAGLLPGGVERIAPRHAIAKAVQRRSKPFLALKLVESVAAGGAQAVPAPLARLIDTCVRLARDAPRRAVEARRAMSKPNLSEGTVP